MLQFHVFLKIPAEFSSMWTKRTLKLWFLPTFHLDMIIKWFFPTVTFSTICTWKTFIGNFRACNIGTSIFHWIWMNKGWFVLKIWLLIKNLFLWFKLIGCCKTIITSVVSPLIKFCNKIKTLVSGTQQNHISIILRTPCEYKLHINKCYTYTRIYYIIQFLALPQF